MPGAGKPERADAGRSSSTLSESIIVAFAAALLALEDAALSKRLVTWRSRQTRAVVHNPEDQPRSTHR